VGPLVAILVATGYVVWGHIFVQTTPDHGFVLDEQLQVTSTRRGSDAARGLRPGDRLWRVRPGPRATLTLRSGFHWLVIKNRLVRGERTEFTFLRAGRPVQVTLEGRRPPLFPGAFWSLGSYLVVLALCLVMWARRGTVPGLGWLIIVILNVYIIIYGFTRIIDLLASIPLFMGNLAFNLFSLPLMLHLFLRYPAPVPLVVHRPWLPALLYVPQVGITTLSVVGYFQLRATPEMAEQGRMLALGTQYIPLVFLAYMLGGLGVMVWRFWTSPPEQRRQIQWIMYGAVLTGLLTVAFAVVRWRTSPQAWILLGNPYLLPIYALLALTIAFAFLDFRGLDVDRLVHRSLVYALVSGAAGLIYLGFAGGLGWMLTRIFDITSTTVTVLAIGLCAALFFPLRHTVQVSLDRLFFRQRNVYQEILQQASSELVTILDLDRLAKVLLEMLVNRLRYGHARLLLATDNRTLRVVHGAGQAGAPVEPLPSVDSFLLRKLRAYAVGETVAARDRLAQVEPPRLAVEFTAVFEQLGAELILFLVIRDRILGLLTLGPKADRAPVPLDEIDTLVALGRQLSVVVRNASAYSEIERLSRDLARRQQEILALKTRLEDENIYLREEIHEAARFGEIVGQAEPMRAVLELVGRVAATDATVLITGESGTGKELIARAIHEASPRREAALVTINCAAIPEGLLESELFGHVKGAFTGAVARKKGRFEVADRGTLFFDEIGDMPLALQAKLLRALQEREIVPVGGEAPIKVDVRVLSATHRDLTALVAEGRFREDLYYRLNVVPLTLPALRERVSDIPLLAEYFMERFARRNGKKITGISVRAMDRLMRYPWPGNVRELANIVERAVVLSESSVLDAEVVLPTVPGRPGEPAATAPEVAETPAFHDAVIAYKRQVLSEALRKAGGNRAAAARALGLQRTYLHRLLKQLELE
jgi:transcriptional regulator with GAF, ATPase, and Fis domain